MYGRLPEAEERAVPELLEQFHRGDKWRGALFPIGKVGSPVVIGEDLSEVFSSLLQILNTKKGERVMYPGFGSNLRGLLWEPHDVFFRQTLGYEIRRAINQWEPRVILLSTVYDPNPIMLDLGILIISLELRVVNNPRSSQNVLIPLSAQGTFLTS